jgi:hypothetical protein
LTLCAGVDDLSNAIKSMRTLSYLNVSNNLLTRGALKVYPGYFQADRREEGKWGEKDSDFETDMAGITTLTDVVKVHATMQTVDLRDNGIGLAVTAPEGWHDDASGESEDGKDRGRWVKAKDLGAKTKSNKTLEVTDEQRQMSGETTVTEAKDIAGVASGPTEVHNEAGTANLTPAIPLWMTGQSKHDTKQPAASATASPRKELEYLEGVKFFV